MARILVQILIAVTLLLVEDVRAVSRDKRYAIEGSFWGVKNITYRISRPVSSLTEEEMHSVLKRAFKVWEERTQLKFHLVDTEDAHIDILFVSGAHGDGEPFDGAGKILAHAFFPRYGGDLHFDDDELWSPDRRGPGLDLYAVAVHEVGHALGLKHSEEHDAIMAPFYKTYTGDRLHLHNAKLYGPTGAAMKQRSVTPRKLVPDLCRDSRLDAATQLPNGTIYFFQGKYFWQLSGSDQPPGRPKKISSYWGVEGPLDAVINTHGLTYLFKRSQYYVLTRHCKMLPGYPRAIAKGLIDTPEGIDAAMQWKNEVFFIKKNKYWPYSRYGMGEEWPKSTSDFFPSNIHSIQIDAALKIRKEGSFIFAGAKYWKMSENGLATLPGFPKSIARNWFSCDKLF